MDDRPTPDRTRREGVEAFPIILADGNAWGLSLPSPRLRPRVLRGLDALGRPTEAICVSAEFGHPIAIRRLVDGLRSACEAGGADRQYEALILLAAALIRRAHDIDLEFAASLLELGVDELPRLVEAVLGVATGNCPEDPAPPRKNDADG